MWFGPAGPVSASGRICPATIVFCLAASACLASCSCLTTRHQVIPRLGVRRHAAIPGHRRFAGIVRRQRQPIIPPIQIQQVLQIFGAALNVLRRVEYIGNAETAGRGGNELHQPLRAFRRNRGWIVIALDFDDGMNHLWLEGNLRGNLLDGFIDAGGRGRFGLGGRGNHARRDQGRHHPVFRYGFRSHHHASHQLPGAQVRTDDAW